MAASRSKKIKRLTLEVISLSSPRGRLMFFGMATLAVFVSKYAWLANLSLWQRLGWESAPSIGLTRAYWLLIHGQPAAAWQRNWLIYPVVLVVLFLILKDALAISSRHRQGK